jgi:hypothetical protein
VKWTKKTQRHTHKDTDRQTDRQRTFVLFSEERRRELELMCCAFSFLLCVLEVAVFVEEGNKKGMVLSVLLQAFLRVKK